MTEGHPLDVASRGGASRGRYDTDQEDRLTAHAQPLTSGFPANTREEWMSLVETVLKGQPFDKRLVRSTADDVAVQPLETAATAAKACGPLFGPRDVDRPWDLRCEITHPDPKSANLQILQDLEGGAASVLLKLDPAGETGIAVGSAVDLAEALEGVYLELAPVALDAGFLGVHAADWLGELGKRAPNAPLAFHMDPLSAFAESGASPGSIESHIALAAETGARWAVPYAKATFFLASGRVVHEAGGSEGQEIAFALSAAVAYAKALVAAGRSMPEAFGRIVLGLAAEETYFTSLAKLRATRRLWSQVTRACGVDPPAKIEARSSRRMLSTLDPWVNLLRLSAAGFAASVGGADAVILAPFTEPMGHPSELARRQARNTQLVLMEEAQLGRVSDPAAGAYSLETLTDGVARKAWAIFQEIEARGGVVKALALGAIQSDVATVRGRRDKDLSTRRQGMIGVNEFPLLTDSPVDLDQVTPSDFAKAPPPISGSGPDSRCEPLAPWRAAEAYEHLRERARRLSSPPVAVVATLGSIRDFAARAGFIDNALAAGGIATKRVPVTGVLSEEARLVVLCGADGVYETEGVEAVTKLKAAGAGRILVAGRPSNLDSLIAAGASGALYLGGDLVSLLGDCLEAFA